MSIVSPRNLSLAVSAALAMGSSVAQTLGPVAGEQRGASPLLPVQNSDSAYVETFYNLEGPTYTFCDAKLLAHLWGTDTWEAKARAGWKLSGGEVGSVNAYLAEARGLLEAQHRSRGDVCTIDDADNPAYSWEDLEYLAQYWGEPTANDAKLKVEDALFWGHNALVWEALNTARGV